jgi:hypothetical protein
MSGISILFLVAILIAIPILYVIFKFSGEKEKFDNMNKNLNPIKRDDHYYLEGIFKNSQVIKNIMLFYLMVFIISTIIYLFLLVK